MHHNTHEDVQGHRNSHADAEACFTDLRNQFRVMTNDVTNMEKTEELTEVNDSIVVSGGVADADYVLDLDDRLPYSIFVSFMVSATTADVTLTALVNSTVDKGFPITLPTTTTNSVNHSFEFLRQQGAQFRLRATSSANFTVDHVKVVAVPVIEHEKPAELIPGICSKFL